MRALTRTEKFLLLILLLIVVGGANLYGYRWLTQKQQALNHERLELRADQAEARLDLQKPVVDLWMQRKAWIAAHEPALGDEGDTKAQILQGVQKGARDNKLEILEQNLGDVQHGAAGARVNVSVKIKGSMEGLCHWLSDLQKPEKFYAVTQMSLIAAEDQKSMVCTLQICRYFKGGS